MIFDSHMHTVFSSDSKMTLNDAIDAAKNKNLGIIITEHMDLDYPNPNEFRCDIPNYLKAYENFRSDKLLLGIEIGMASSTLVENEQIPKNFDLDFVIGSIHSVNGLDIYSSAATSNLSEEEYYKNYYENMLDCVKNYNDFDALGHIDYIYRYAPFKNPEISLKYSKDLIFQIMSTLINKDKALEINTRRLSNPVSAKALFEVFKFYKELGGNYVTIGSDAHGPSVIGSNFNIALDIINTLDLKGVYFKNRQLNYFQ